MGQKTYPCCFSVDARSMHFGDSFFGALTRHYVHLARHDIAEQHKKFSPMELLLGKPAQAAKTRALELAAA